MNKFKTWYVDNQDAITWFVIGLLTSSGIDQLARGSYLLAGISFAVAYLNYSLRKTRLT
jgi:hypothetical protein